MHKKPSVRPSGLLFHLFGIQTLGTNRRQFAYHSLFLAFLNWSHVARLDDALANMALQLHSNVSLNRPPDRTWRHPPGRPRNKWLDQLRNDSTVRLETSGGILSTVDMVGQNVMALAGYVTMTITQQIGGSQCCWVH